MNGSGNTEFTLFYLLGIFGMILLAGIIAFFYIFCQKKLFRKELELNHLKAQQQEEILNATILSREQEQKRIARDLHDEVGVMLSVIKINLSLFERNTDNQKLKVLASETKDYLDEVILQIRRISRALMPSSIETHGLAAAVEEMVGWLGKTGIINIRYWQARETFRLNPQKELAVFRIIQELITNAIKHADASTIDLKLRFTKKCLALSVSDDGCGFKPEECTDSGMGLKNIDFRVKLLKARIKIKSAPGKGTTVILITNTTSEAYGAIKG